jgi:hypothetical protein
MAALVTGKSSVPSGSHRLELIVGYAVRAANDDFCLVSIHRARQACSKVLHPRILSVGHYRNVKRQAGSDGLFVLRLNTPVPFTIFRQYLLC